MAKYAAFLRGINSGKNPSVRMEVLRKAFEDLGYRKVKTVLASGNVLFESSANAASLEGRLEKALPGILGFESGVIVRGIDGLLRLLRSKPFKDIDITPQTRLYVTFVKQITRTRLDLPLKGKGYTILGVSEGAACSVVDLASAKTPDLMQVLDKLFGKANTTRSWDTVRRVGLLSGTNLA